MNAADVYVKNAQLKIRHDLDAVHWLLFWLHAIIYFFPLIQIVYEIAE